MKINGSQILIECLVEQGVDTIFGYPGGAILNIYDALYKNSDRITHILTAHEQNAAHAADGYARVTGKVGVCLATSGPGATNLITGIATAYMDSIPMIAITGNVSTSLLGKDSFQEIDIFNVTMPITKHNFIVKNINELADTIRKAFLIAKSGRPGPVLIDIPKDITAAVIEYTYKKPQEIVIEPFTGDLDLVVDLIQKAEKPVIFAGGGVLMSGASKELREFVKRINAPITTSLMGIGAYPETDELSTGMLGMHGAVASNKAVLNSDLLIAIGTRFSDRVLLNINRFAPNAKVVHIDIDVAEHGKNIKPDISVYGDARMVLLELLKKFEQKDNFDWIKQITTWKKSFNNFQDNKNLNPRYMMEEANKITKGKAVVTTEVGQHQMWVAQYYKFSEPRKLLTSGGLGTMGYGTGAAIGAAFGDKKSQILHFAGDGSFRMNLTELATIEHYKLPIIIILVNNKTLGMVRQWQKAFYGHRFSHTTLDRGPDFNKLADAFNIKNYYVRTQEEYSKALKEAVTLGVPVLINADISIDDKVLPLVPAGAGIDDFILE